MSDAPEQPPMTRDEAYALILAETSPYATTQVQVRGVDYTYYRHAPDNLRDWYALGARHAERDFLVYEDERYTFGETFALVARVAAALQARGVKKGDRVAIAMRNYPEWPITFMAITSIGAVAVGLNAWWTTEELKYGLQDSGASFVFADGQRFERLRPLIETLACKPVVVRPEEEIPAGVERYADWIAGDEVSLPQVEVGPEDDMMILYTSGSTGYPKGAVSTHRAGLATIMTYEVTGVAGLMTGPLRVVADFIGAWLQKGPAALTEEVVPGMPQYAVLLNVPLFHVTGLYVMLLLSIRTGRKMVMMHRWDAGEALKLIERERVTHFSGVPTMSWELVNHPDFDRHDTSSLIHISGGGAARPASQVKGITDRLKQSSAASGYGLTETNALGAAIAGDDYKARPNATGRPYRPTVEVRIEDPQGKPLPVGEEGEICIKSPTNMRAYWNKPEATEETLRDGWVHTGDIGRFDDEGFLYITDRAKDIVIRGGENISCREVEDCLCSHPAVFEAAVYGIADERLGERLVGSVMLRPDVPASEAELQAHVTAHLAAFKVPTHILITHESLPRLATGKIDKRGLRTAYAG